MNPNLHFATWRKSSFSGGEGGNCVELANIGAVRDGKNPTGSVLRVDLANLVEFVKRGRF